MRGAPSAAEESAKPTGIIPADAGSTERIRHWRKTLQDHPRGCGEHIYAKLNDKEYTGSSPRMRGALTCEQC